MQILGIQTSVLKAGDNLAATLVEDGSIEPGDIVVVSSKAVATCEGAAINLGDLEITGEARKLSESSGTQKEAAHVQVILHETKRMNGEVLLTSHGIMLTELQPDGMTAGRILVTNAGLDLSNTVPGTAIGWPVDCAKSASDLREALGGNVGVIISDSGLCPRRKGVMAFALAVAGFDPIQSQVGTPDIFGRELTVTEEAVADQLATAANFVMGNAGQSTPVAIIRDHGVALNDFSGWVNGIEPKLDIFHGLI